MSSVLTAAGEQLNSEAPALAPSLERVLLRVRLRARRRVLWLRRLWGQEEAPGGRLSVTHGEVETHLLDKDAPAAEAAWVGSDPVARDLTRQIAVLEDAIHADDTSRLARLERLFGLNPEERDLFQACLAAALDPSLGRVYAYLQDLAARTYVTEELVGRLFGHGRSAVLKPRSSLRMWALVAEQDIAPGEPKALTCDPVVRDWLRGEEYLDECLVGLASLTRTEPPLRDWPVTEVASWIQRALEGDDGCARVRISGVPGSGRRTFAACVSARLGFRLLALESGRIPEAPLTQVLVRAHRQAHLSGYALAWHGHLATLSAGSVIEPPAPIQFLITDGGATGLAGASNAPDHAVELPLPSLDERRELWCRYVPSSTGWDSHQADALFGRQRATVGLIREVSRRGITAVSKARTLLSEHSRERLGDLVQVVECPFTWDDLVVSKEVREALEELVFEASEQARLWEEARLRRLFPRGRGVFALLVGPPGVGKTMSAQVVAAALQRDLYVVDVANIVSKWVGETSKNLIRVLSTIPTDEVLLFDEADGLFGKRPTDMRDANDRFVTGETGVLLEAVERYQGVAFLAANRKELDHAFTRRFRHVLNFRRPDAAQRLLLWRRLVDCLAGDGRADSLFAGLAVLARDVEATGGQIKDAVLSGVLSARRTNATLAMAHLVGGLDRALRKEGRSWSLQERQRMCERAI